MNLSGDTKKNLIKVMSALSLVAFYYIRNHMSAGTDKAYSGSDSEDSTAYSESPSPSILVKEGQSNVSSPVRRKYTERMKQDKIDFENLYVELCSKFLYLKDYNTEMRVEFGQEKEFTKQMDEIDTLMQSLIIYLPQEQADKCNKLYVDMQSIASRLGSYREVSFSPIYKIYVAGKASNVKEILETEFDKASPPVVPSIVFSAKIEKEIKGPILMQGELFVEESDEPGPSCHPTW